MALGLSASVRIHLAAKPVRTCACTCGAVGVDVHLS